jgi:hypothetical protein
MTAERKHALQRIVVYDDHAIREDRAGALGKRHRIGSRPLRSRLR